MISNEEYSIYRNYQKGVNEIISTEHSRLDSKKANMDTNISNQNRMIALNTSYRDKQQKYILIIMIFVMIFILSLVIIFFQETFNFSTQVLDILIFLIIAAGLISATIVYQEIRNRDKIDFSQLSRDSSNLLPAKPTLKVTDADQNAIIKNATSSSSSTANICRGSACCNENQAYDIVARTCILK